MWQKIEALMKERGLNASRLSEVAGINRSFLTDLKSGKVKHLSWKNAVKIADALDVSLDEFR